MKQLYFIRHGESEFNKAKKWAGGTDTPLTEKGHAQAKESGRLVKEEGLVVDLIISSPLQRAHDTAKHIASTIDYPHQKILIDELLIERSFGELEGKKEIRAIAEYLINEGAIDKYKGVESMIELHDRARKFLQYANSLEHTTILVVGHGAFARALRRVINDEPMNIRGKTWSNAEVVRLI